MHFEPAPKHRPRVPSRSMLERTRAAPDIGCGARMRHQRAHQTGHDSIQQRLDHGAGRTNETDVDLGAGPDGDVFRGPGLVAHAQQLRDAHHAPRAPRSR